MVTNHQKLKISSFELMMFVIKTVIFDFDECVFEGWRKGSKVFSDLLMWCVNLHEHKLLIFLYSQSLICHLTTLTSVCWQPETLMKDVIGIYFVLMWITCLLILAFSFLSKYNIVLCTDQQRTPRSCWNLPNKQINHVTPWSLFTLAWHCT